MEGKEKTRRTIREGGREGKGAASPAQQGSATTELVSGPLGRVRTPTVSQQAWGQSPGVDLGQAKAAKWVSLSDARRVLWVYEGGTRVTTRN